MGDARRIGKGNRKSRLAAPERKGLSGLWLGDSEGDPYRGPLPKAALMSNTASALFPTHTSWVWSTNKARLSYRPHRSGTTANSNITPSST